MPNSRPNYYSGSEETEKCFLKFSKNIEFPSFFLSLFLAVSLSLSLAYLRKHLRARGDASCQQQTWSLHFQRHKAMKRLTKLLHAACQRQIYPVPDGRSLQASPVQREHRCLLRGLELPHAMHAFYPCLKIFHNMVENSTVCFSKQFLSYRFEIISEFSHKLHIHVYSFEGVLHLEKNILDRRTLDSSE